MSKGLRRQTTVLSDDTAVSLPEEEARGVWKEVGVFDWGDVEG